MAFITYLCTSVFMINLLIEMKWINDVYILPMICFLAFCQVGFFVGKIKSEVVLKVPLFLVSPIYWTHVFMTWDQVPFVEMNLTRTFMCIVPVGVSLLDLLVEMYPTQCWTLWKIKTARKVKRNPFSEP